MRPPWTSILLALAVACSDDSGVDRRSNPPGQSGDGDQDGGLPAPDVDALLEGNCAKSSRQTKLLPSNVLFVLDRSLSMTCNPPPFTPSEQCEAAPRRDKDDVRSKWEITRRALHNAIAELPSDTTVGLSYFSNDDSCGVHSQPSVPMAPLVGAQLTTIQASLESVEPAGATPIVGATILAYRHLHELALAQAIRGNKFVVLLTDGDQSAECVDSDRCDSKDDCTRLLVEDEAPKAAASGVNIRTFVIGAPGSEPARQTLSELATSGGTAKSGCRVADGDCHFDMTATADFNASLAEALTNIAGATTPCEFPIPTPDEGVEVEQDFLNVIYSPGDGGDAVLVRRDDGVACTEANGWQYTSEGSKIRLCGEVCDGVHGGARGRVDVVLGCKTLGPE